MTKFDFPAESNAYRAARAELLTAEIALKDQTERVAAMRRALPLGMEDAEGNQQPGLSVFTRGAGGAVSHRYTVAADLDAENGRGIDPYSPVWNLFDLTPAGRGDWFPGHDYMPPGGRVSEVSLS
ncbi:MAG: DUF899 family protein [Thermomicrobia bacterium]|nr:DUF899 family protein [Thermomicrobia bacterium]